MSEFKESRESRRAKFQEMIEDAEDAILPCEFCGRIVLVEACCQQASGMDDDVWTAYIACFNKPKSFNTEEE